jgi:hypothetical protein
LLGPFFISLQKKPKPLLQEENKNKKNQNKRKQTKKNKQPPGPRLE